MWMKGARIGRRCARPDWAVRVGSTGCAGGVWRRAVSIGVVSVAVFLVPALASAGRAGQVHPRLAFVAPSNGGVAGMIGPVWAIERNRNPAAAKSFLKGVSCPSARLCIAVGVARGFPLIERWNGSQWAIQHSDLRSGHRRGVLYGVSCASERSCVAVGVAGGLAVAERWNGARWSVQRLSSPPGVQSSVLRGVSCESPMGCMAVGSFTTRQGGFPLLERWNGFRWSIQPGVKLFVDVGGEGGEMQAVSCTSDSACIAVGSLNASETRCLEGWVAERWNGIRWTLLPALCSAPNYDWGEMEPRFDAVACASARSCVAGGQDTASGAGNFPIGARWNGTSWTSAREFDIAAFTDGETRGVSCPSKMECVAVGTWDARPHGFAVEWSAGRWRSRQRADTARIFPQAVSCPSATSCMVVGNWGNRAASALLRP
jgi:hypothetical protein